MKNDNNSFYCFPYSCCTYSNFCACNRTKKNYNYYNIEREVFIHDKNYHFTSLIDITVNPSIYSFNNILFVQHLWCHFFMNSLTLYSAYIYTYAGFNFSFLGKKSIRCTRQIIFFCV